MKTSKVKNVQDVKEWNSKNGAVYYHNVELENGDKINIGKKKKLQIGDEITYEIIGDLGQHEYTKAKSVQPENTSYRSSTNTKGIEIGHAINNAVNMICAGVDFDNVDSELKTGQKIEAYARNILAISNKLKNE
ncbi:MAG TPA: hypothetical protein DC015_13500 [Aequorivita sp.]|nr:hypothetical protein [Aequorivita sp.]|tara:strand:- start:819 stop:1220 length:402 start_codon:yes stop_codon:yes gene_type:complete